MHDTHSTRIHASCLRDSNGEEWTFCKFCQEGNQMFQCSAKQRRARQRLGKHIPAGTNARNKRKSIARQRISKAASLTTEAVFSPWSVQSGYKEEFRSWQQHSRFSSCRELGRVLEMAVEGDGEEMARKELGGVKKTSYVPLRQ
jgi:hypothetical protein